MILNSICRFKRCPWKIASTPKGPVSILEIFSLRWEDFRRISFFNIIVEEVNSIKLELTLLIINWMSLWTIHIDLYIWLLRNLLPLFARMLLTLWRVFSWNSNNMSSMKSWQHYGETTQSQESNQTKSSMDLLRNDKCKRCSITQNKRVMKDSIYTLINQPQLMEKINKSAKSKEDQTISQETIKQMKEMI